MENQFPDGPSAGSARCLPPTAPQSDFRGEGDANDVAGGGPCGRGDATEPLNVSVYAGVELEPPERGCEVIARLLERLLSFSNGK